MDIQNASLELPQQNIPKRQVRKLPCQICNKVKALSALVPTDLIRPSLRTVIIQKHPEWDQKGYICRADLNHIKAKYIQEVLEDERGRISNLEKEVLESLKENELLSENINQQFDRELTLGEHIADKVASFGGSWRFILSFLGFMLLWIVLNMVLLKGRPFDPYPFILLNLMLSCLAALQAPVIMMSQNRQEDKDRMRSEYDYKVNLKAELEIRHLNEKMDHLIQYQWQHLLEIQELQLDLIQELAKTSRNKRS